MENPQNPIPTPDIKITAGSTENLSLTSSQKSSRSSSINTQTSPNINNIKSGRSSAGENDAKITNSILNASHDSLSRSSSTRKSLLSLDKPQPPLPKDGNVPSKSSTKSSDQDEEVSEKRDSVYSDLKRRITLGKSWKLNRQGSIRSRSSSSRSSDTSTKDVPEPVVQTENVDVTLKVEESENDADNKVSSIESSILAPAEENHQQPQQTNLSPEKRKKYVEVRKYILGELLETEKNYVSNLEIVLQNFKVPLVKAAGSHAGQQGLNSTGSSFFASNHDFGSSRNLERSLSGGHSTTNSKGAIIPLVDIKIIFAFIDDLWEFNREFAKDLEAVVLRWEKSEEIWNKLATGESPNEQPLSIGQLFLSNARNWSVYLKFVDNYSSAKEAIRRSEENSPAYRQFIQDCLKSKECQRQGIADFLILPVQRVTRYVLLLQDLKKHTPSDHPDYINILSGLDDMRKLANTVNEVKRREEEMTRMFYVLRTVDECPPTIISAQRRVLFETDGVDVTRSNPQLVLHPVALTNGGISIAPSPASALDASKDGGNSNNSQNGPSPIKLYIFSDLLMLAKPQKKKKEKSAITKYISGGDGKKDKLALFRMSWLHDVEIHDVETSGPPGKQKFMIKVVIYNSDGGNMATRKKFWAELATANTAAKSSSTIGPRGSSKKAKSIDENRSADRHTPSPLQISSAPTSPMAQIQTQGVGDTSDSQSEPPLSPLPTVESIEKLARERLSTTDNNSSSSAAVAMRPARTSSVVGLQRASTIISKSPSPRKSSLIIGGNVAPVEPPAPPKDDSESLSSSRQSLDSADTRHTIEVGSLNVSLERKSSLTASSATVSTTFSSIPTPQSLVETFIVEFAEKKQKNEVMLVVEKLALEKRLRSKSSINSSITHDTNNE